WPVPQLVRTELLPVPVMSPEMVPASVRGWLTDITSRMQCPFDFVAVGALVVLSSVIGAGCGIRPKRRDDWLVIPNTWGAVVGPPSLMVESAAVAEIIRSVNRLETVANDKQKADLKFLEGEVEMFNARKESIKKDMRAAARGDKKNIDEYVARNE